MVASQTKSIPVSLRSAASTVAERKSRPRSSQPALTQAACLDDAEDVVVAALEARYGTNAATSQKVAGEMRRFFRHMRAHGVMRLDEISNDLIIDFCWSAVKHRGRVVDVTARTAANRQSFLRAAVEELTRLGLWTPNASVDSIPRGFVEQSRPMTRDELHQAETYATNGASNGQRALLVAFAEAGGDAAEIATVTANDIGHDTATVHFRGQAERTNPMSPWGAHIVAEYLRTTRFEPNQRLCVKQTTPTKSGAQAVARRLCLVLRDAGLASAPGVTARSIRLGAAVQVLERAGLEAAARFLGNRSLDATATALGYNWRTY
jgi:site-specific recombinase XerD